MRRLILASMIILAAQCRDRFDVPYPTPVTGYLVVDGFINYGDSTAISLSRTTQLAERGIVPESNASVSVQGEDGSTFPLIGNDSGAYRSAVLPLNETVRYRINIVASDGKQYQSDYSNIHVTPAIDSVPWKRQNNGIDIFIASHDATDSTLYYKWDYTETWECHSSFITNLEYSYDVLPSGERTNYAVVHRPNNEYNLAIATCWRTETSTSILLGSTKQLASDVIYAPLKSIPEATQRIGVLYSIIVEQRALSTAAYDFYQRMKKNSEALGTIFDPQPSESKGNIHNLTDPAEPVIGFIEAASSTKKRIFISPADVPDWNYIPDCAEYRPSTPDEEYPFANIPDVVKEVAEGKGVLPTAPGRTGPGNVVITFHAAPIRCVDCTISGTNQKPSFWP